MGRFLLNWHWAFVLVIALAGTAGCTGLDVAFSRLRGQETTDVVPGVPSPAEKTATLAKIRERASWADPAEQEQLSTQLAAAFGEEPDPAIRAEIARAAAGYRTEAAAALLRTALGDPVADVRIAGCRALGQRPGDAEAVTLLSGVLAADMDTDVRMAAVAALGETGDRTAIPALGEALEDRDPAMQYRAVQALRQVSGEDLGNDVNQWRQYVRGEISSGRQPASMVERFRRMF